MTSVLRKLALPSGPQAQASLPEERLVWEAWEWPKARQAKRQHRELAAVRERLQALQPGPRELPIPLQPEAWEWRLPLEGAEGRLREQGRQVWAASPPERQGQWVLARLKEALLEQGPPLVSGLREPKA